MIEAVEQCKFSTTDGSIVWNKVANTLGEGSAEEWKTYWINELLPKFDVMTSHQCFLLLSQALATTPIASSCDEITSEVST